MSTPGSRILLRCVLYYIVLLGGSALLWVYIPHAVNEMPSSLEALLGQGSDAVSRTPAVALDEVSLAITVAVAMAAAALLSLPIAWVFLLTRTKRGYQQSVVQLLIILPTVVAGIVLLVKYSLALAFSLAGIVAAVRFRNSLDDSKDAVYVFLATAIGLASAVNLPVAAVLSVGFNLLAFALWYSDFGSSPVELDGRIAERRLQRAKQMSRTGTFVARMDDEVLRNMTSEQLEGLAQRAWRRAQANHITDEMPAVAQERTLRLVSTDASALRRALEPRLSEFTKQWRFGGLVTGDETTALEYIVQLRKRSNAEELLSLVRASGGVSVISVELE
jgi:hypothetical protein